MFGNKKKRSSKRKPAPQVDPADTIKATQALKEKVQLLEKRRDFLHKKSRNILALAKKDMVNKEKSAALLKMKKKQIFDKEINVVDSSILGLEQQILNLESGATNLDVYEAMKLGAAAQKKINSSVDPDKIADLMSSIEDLNGDAAEISDLLAMNGEDTLNDPDLMQALEELEADMMEESAFALPTAPEEPLRGEGDLDDLLDFDKFKAPTNNPRKKEKEADEAALAELEAEMLVDG